jgi:hypothetical protein
MTWPMTARLVRPWLGAAGLAAAVALTGCGHTRSVENPASAGVTSGRSEKDGKAKAANDTPPSDQHARRSASARSSGPVSDDKKKGDQPSEVPLSTSPAGQLEDGAVKKIQARLAGLGFLDEGDETGQLDERTEAALRKFQKSRDLAATGTPDQETVRKLGLDPGQIFRAAH